MALVKAGSCAALEPGRMMEAIVDGTPYAVCNVNGDLHAVSGICPHRGGPLAQGALHDYTIVCPWHAWEFDCRTGEHDFDPGVKLKKYPVTIESGDIYLDLP
jgi:nitrite reductase (NADH) small subunit